MTSLALHIDVQMGCSKSRISILSALLSYRHDLFDTVMLFTSLVLQIASRATNQRFSAYLKMLSQPRHLERNRLHLCHLLFDLELSYRHSTSNSCPPLTCPSELRMTFDILFDCLSCMISVPKRTHLDDFCHFFNLAFLVLTIVGTEVYLLFAAT